MKYLLMLPVRFYRKFLSPLKPPCCRFTPTCSAYALEALEKRGAVVGLLLTVYRFLRCNPFCRGGYDPVPEKGFRNPPLLRQEANRPRKEAPGPDTPYPVVRVTPRRNTNTRENPLPYEKNCQIDASRSDSDGSCDESVILR